MEKNDMAECNGKVKERERERERGKKKKEKKKKKKKKKEEEKKREQNSWKLTKHARLINYDLFQTSKRTFHNACVRRLVKKRRVGQMKLNGP